MPIPDAYRGSITREQWLARETRITARLMLDDGITGAQDLVAHIHERNSFQYPTERELKSIARACIRRIASVSPDPELTARVVELLAHGTVEQLHQANLYAMMCDNRLVWEFMANVVGAKNAKFDRSLRPYEIASFIEGLRAQSETVDGWSDATRNKARQVLAKCIAECSMYDRKQEELLPVFADFELTQIIRANGDARALAAFGQIGHVE